ncbi:MAG: hypothetical protein ABH846_00595 [Patescibacteria group bacterium]
MKKLATFGLIATFSLAAMPALAVFPDQEAMVHKVIENLENADSFEYLLEVDVKYDYEDDPGLYEVDIDVDGAWQDTASNQLRASANINAVVTNEGESDESSLAFVITPDRLYIQEDGQWLYETTDGSNGLTLNVDTNTEEVTDYLTQFATEGITITQKLSNQRVNGVVMERYAYQLNDDGLIAMLRSTGEISEDDLDEIATMLTEVNIYGEIWLEKGTLNPYRLIVEGTALVEEDILVNYSVSLTFTSFDKNTKVLDPAGAKPYTQPDVAPCGNDPELYQDSDEDGLTDLEESTYGTDCNDPDTDNDGYRDGLEVDNGYDPLGPGQLDSDGDGLGNRDEIQIHYSDPYDSDSDDDGYPDGTEIKYGYDPNGPGRIW